MTSSWGGVLVKMMVDVRGGVKSPNWGVHGPIYLNMTLSYRNNAGIVVCLYQYNMISKTCNITKLVP